MIKAIIFDIGGILDKGKPGEHWKKLCKSLKINLEKFEIIRQKYVGAAKIGKLSTKDYISKIAEELGLEYEKLYLNWLRTKRENMKIDKTILKLFMNLKSKGYKIGTVSNIIELHNKVRVERKIYDLLDFVILSFQEGVDKPNPKIYRIAVNKLKLSPEEIIFVDDSERNLKTASELGMKTILFRNNRQLIKRLKSFNVNI